MFNKHSVYQPTISSLIKLFLISVFLFDKIESIDNCYLSYKNKIYKSKGIISY